MQCVHPDCTERMRLGCVNRCRQDAGSRSQTSVFYAMSVDGVVPQVRLVLFYDRLLGSGGGDATPPPPRSSLSLWGARVGDK